MHISDPTFLDQIYAIRDRDQPNSTQALLVEESVGGTQEWSVHKRRRDALNPYFSQKAVLSLEPLLRQKVETLCEWFEKGVATGKPINLSDAYFAFSNEYGYHQRLDNIRSARDRAELCHVPPPCVLQSLIDHQIAA